MNDYDIEELLRGNVPLDSSEARERARLRLRAVIALEEAARARRRRRFVGLAAAAAAAVVGLLSLQVLLPPGSGGPRVSAAEEIRRLGRLSVAQAPLQLEPNEYIYSHYREYTKQSPNDEADYTLVVTTDVESWFANDGSGGRESTDTQIGFASSVDRSKWLDAGSPALPGIGVTRSDRFVAGDLRYFDVARLPTNPTDLKRALEQDPDFVGGEGDANLLVRVGDLLSQENLSPELRQALFEVAAAIPSATVQFGAEDQAGRAAVSVMASDGAVVTTLFFDQSNARLLGSSVVYPPADDKPAFTEWRLYLESGVVSQIGARPSS